MSDESAERRREPRFEIGAQAVVRGRVGGEAHAAVTLNISAGGLLLKLAETNPFQVGDQVECEIALPEPPAHAFAKWGVGRVVRIDADNAAIELEAGIFRSGNGHI